MEEGVTDAIPIHMIRSQPLMAVVEAQRTKCAKEMTVAVVPG